MRIFYIPFCLPTPDIEFLEDGTFKPKKPEIRIGQQSSNKNERHKIELGEGNSLENYLKHLVPKIRMGAFRYGKTKGDSFEICIILTETQYVETLKMYGATEEEAQIMAAELAKEAELKIQEIINKVTHDLKLINSTVQELKNDLVEEDINIVEKISIISWAESYNNEQYEINSEKYLSGEEYQKPIETKKTTAKSLKEACEMDVKTRIVRFKQQLRQHKKGYDLTQEQEQVAIEAVTKFLQIEACAVSCWSQADSLSCFFYPNNLSNPMYAILSKTLEDKKIDSLHQKCQNGLKNLEQKQAQLKIDKIIELGSSPGTTSFESTQTQETSITNSSPKPSPTSSPNLSPSSSDSEHSPKTKRRKISKEGSDSGNESPEEKVTNMVNELAKQGYPNIRVEYELPGGGKIKVQVGDPPSPSKKKPHRKTSEQTHYERKRINYSDAKLVGQQWHSRNRTESEKSREDNKPVSNIMDILNDPNGYIVGENKKNNAEKKRKNNHRTCLIM